jgi:transcriptional regulator with XRE-family HTH domain
MPFHLLPGFLLSAAVDVMNVTSRRYWRQLPIDVYSLVNRKLKESPMPKKPEAQIGPELIVAQRIRQERRAKGWTLDTLARKLQRETGTTVAPSALSMVENGKRRITLNEALAYAEVFGIGLPDLIEPKSEDQRLQDDMLWALRAVYTASTALTEAMISVTCLLGTVDPDSAAEHHGGVLQINGDKEPDIGAAWFDIRHAQDSLGHARKMLDTAAQERTPALWQRIQESPEPLSQWGRP